MSRDAPPGAPGYGLKGRSNRFLGYFATQGDAAREYNKWACLWGKRMNIIKPEDAHVQSNVDVDKDGYNTKKCGVKRVSGNLEPMWERG